MNKAKKTDEKNSLEQLLLKGKDAYEGNKKQSLQYVLYVVLAIVVIVVVRNWFSGASGKLDAADSAYYQATQASFSGVGVADGAVLANTASSYKGTVAGDALNADAGDAYLSAGQSDVAAAQAYSRGVKASEGETKKPANPTDNFTAAFDAYQSATSSSDANVRARAFYGSGVAQESVASVAADDAAVEAALAKAKENYAKVAEACADSPYCAPAAKALANLERPLTVEYYKSAAHKFVTLPEPSAESILSKGSDELKPGEKLNVEDFNTNDDSAEAASNEDAPAAEEASAATDAPAAEEASASTDAPAESK